MAGEMEYPDALAQGSVRGRGAGVNPGNRFESLRLHVLGEHLDQGLAENPDGVQVLTQARTDSTRRIINKVDSPDIGFRWTINPYRGCEHGCIYCYARPGHEMLGYSCGLDFETKIVAKPEAPDLLRKELASTRWKPEPIVMSGVTDCYQPIEKKLEITRQCLEVFAETLNPVSIVTKSRLVTRDIDLLTKLAKHNATRVAVSVTSLDPKLSARMEPRAASPNDRLRTIRDLTSAGIPTVAMIAPVVPAMTDREIPKLLKAVAEAGATSAGWVMLRLPHQVKAVFLDWLHRTFPDRAGHVESLIRQSRQGELYRADWNTRMRGTGPIAEQIKQTFEVFRKRYNLDRSPTQLTTEYFRRPRVNGQMRLFDQ